MIKTLLGLVPGAGVVRSVLKIATASVGLLASLLLFIKPVRRRVGRCLKSILLWPFKTLKKGLDCIWRVIKKLLHKLWRAIDALLSAVRRLVARITALFGQGSSETSSEKSADERDVDETLTDQEKYNIEKEDKLLKRDRASVQEYEVAGGGAGYESAAQIVGVTEPIGKWTQLVMSERQRDLARLFSAGVGDSSCELPNGFWQMFIRMPSRYQGKYMARSR